MAPRRRKNKDDDWLPERVYRGKSSYEWRPPGSYKVIHPLKRDEDGNIIETPKIQVSVLEAYEKAVNLGKRSKDVGFWLTKFMASDKFARLAKSTQSDYMRYIEVRVDPSNPRSQATHNGIRVVFGGMNPLSVEPTHIRRYLDYWNTAKLIELDSGKILKTDGKPSTANKHLACLQTFFKWLRQYIKGLEVNPADGIIKFEEKARQVYISDEDYIRFHEASLDSTTPWLAPYLSIAYLAGLRRAEVWDLNHSDITTENGIQYLRVIRKKGSKGEMVEIEGLLKASIDLAISLYPVGVPEPMIRRPIVRNTRGERITASALQNAMTSIRKKTGIHDIVMHDMKKKAGSDGKDLGHRTKRMAELYNLKLTKTKATK